MVTIVQHDCSTCKFHKRKIEVGPVDVDDIKVYNRIQTQINNTQQAADPTALSNLPSTVSSEDKLIYMKAALENKEKAQALIAEWWREMIKKYHVPMSAKFDVDEGIFYECVDDAGVPDMNGQYIEK